MKAEIISIGTEITSGRNLDTNSQWLSLRLGEIGVPVAFHTTLSDDLADNIAAMRIASERADLVLITGGLGPTLDDLTREALAAVAGVELVFDQSSFDAIHGMFQRRNREMPERNRVQALFPVGAEPIPNEHGTAPGIWMRLGRAWVAALPGVPREMHEMYPTIRGKLLALGLADGVIVERKLNCFGAGESQLEEQLKDLTARGRDPEVGITASDATISLRIIARANDEATARAAIAPTEAIIRERLGDMVFGSDDEDLHDVVMRLLVEHRVTLATAESITAGQVAERLARVPGASAWLRGGVIAYTNAVKMGVLGVPEELIREHGAVSREVVEAMAVGVRRLLGSDLAVATTGLAGPGDGGEGKPVGLTWIGLAWDGGSISRSITWFGWRTEVQSRAAKSALNLIRLKLEKKVSP